MAAKVRAGADAWEARRQARLKLGDAEAARERLREGRAGFWLDSVRKDAAYALRMLRKRPGFSVVCVLTIGLGVGASTALFASARRGTCEAPTARFSSFCGDSKLIPRRRARGRRGCCGLAEAAGGERD